MIVAAPPGFEGAVGKIAAQSAAARRDRHRGATRSESVKAALGAASEAELIAVHDAARPLVTTKLIDSLVARLVAILRLTE